MGTRSTKALSRIQQAVIDELAARGPFEIPDWPYRNWAYRGGDMVLFKGGFSPGKATFQSLVNAGLIKMDIPSRAKLGRHAAGAMDSFLRPGSTPNPGPPPSTTVDLKVTVRRGRCFKCNGTGELCQQCGEAEGACVCRGGFSGYDCDDCGGTGK